jgi:hypothetical protein
VLLLFLEVELEEFPLLLRLLLLLEPILLLLERGTGCLGEGT